MGREQNELMLRFERGILLRSSVIISKNHSKFRIERCRITRWVKIYSELYAWVAVFMLPINSALNPVLYTDHPAVQAAAGQDRVHVEGRWSAGGRPARVVWHLYDVGALQRKVVQEQRIPLHIRPGQKRQPDFLISANSRTSARCNWPSPLAYIVYENSCF
ncbi:hypothetical protein CEXT_338861 [Caerostris extrusa]|uniref:G-protein coupled receptors family 1 profile domain-containing protein n=1 Tax=Caerostris extrusa TaxID=172846 RepID=A0AAV4XN30_CAEEX|nr:hypothetical protein CEXT_338861 [Caerostris extrusa]